MNTIKQLMAVLICLLSLTTIASEGIQFEENSWAEIKAQAQNQNKIIFMDAYASWCGPCKWMDKNVFVNDTVGKFYNNNFICVKIDMEKDEGVDIADEYGVESYPTFLFIDGKGNLLHRARGSHKTADFVFLGEMAINSSMRLDAWDKKYADGKRDVKFLIDYLDVLLVAGQPTEEVSEKYFEIEINNLLTEVNLEMIIKYLNGTESATFKYFAANKKAFVDIGGEKKIELKFEDLYTDMYMKTIKYRKKKDGSKVAVIDEEGYKKAVTEIHASGMMRTRMIMLQANMRYYKAKKLWTRYASTTMEYVDNFGEPDWQMYNKYAWDFYEHVDGDEFLARATKWAEMSVRLKPNYYNHDTYAALLFKTNKLAEAKTTAQRAIEIAKKERLDYSSTEELLDKIEME